MKMEQKNDNYLVYKAQNLNNGQVYIGVSSKSIEDRKRDHLTRVDKRYSCKFQESISTFGMEAFSWVQIDSAFTTDELALKEKHYILKYNSKEKGYNSDAGGGFKKTVYQYNLQDGTLISKHDSLESAGEKINATKQQLSRACLSVNKTFGGFYWSYQYEEPFNPKLDNRKKSIVQLDNYDRELNCFNSIAEASDVTGCNKSSIAKVCRGERNHAGGYYWKYK